MATLYARCCSVTGEGMNSGWVLNDGEEYFKYESDAATAVRAIYGYDMTNEQALEQAYDDEILYWTEWEDEDDYEYQLVDGELIEINN